MLRIAAVVIARGMFRPASPPPLADSIVNSMVNTGREVGIPALQGLEAWGRDRQAAAASALSARVGLIVAGSKPTPAFFEGGRGAALLVGVERMPDAGHFLMQEDPDSFNARLRSLIGRLF